MASSALMKRDQSFATSLFDYWLYTFACSVLDLSGPPEASIAFHIIYEYIVLCVLLFDAIQSRQFVVYRTDEVKHIQGSVNCMSVKKQLCQIRWTHFRMWLDPIIAYMARKLEIIQHVKRDLELKCAGQSHPVNQGHRNLVGTKCLIRDKRRQKWVKLVSRDGELC